MYHYLIESAFLEMCMRIKNSFSSILTEFTGSSADQSQLTADLLRVRETRNGLGVSRCFS